MYSAATRNGWVYALSETDGKLAWRFLAAAEQRLIGMYGRLESAWPLFGSILINNGKLYCASGRTSYLDGGIDAYELDPHTGQMLETKHYHDIDPETGKSPKTKSALITVGVKNDILVACGDSVFMNHKRVFGEEKGVWEKADAKPKKEKPGKKKNIKPTSRKTSLVYKGPKPDIHVIASGTFLDDSYFTRTAISVGTSYGQLIAYNGMIAYGLQVYETAGRNSHFYPGTSSVRLYSSNILPRKEPWSPNSYVNVGRGNFETNWSVNIPVRGKAMVLTNETLFVCGQPDIFDPKDPFAAIDGKLGSVLIAVSTVNGDILAEHKIESIPVFDSLIAANSSLYMTTEDGKVHCYK